MGHVSDRAPTLSEMNFDDRIPGLDQSQTTFAYANWHRHEIELRSFLVASTTGMSSWFSTKEKEASEAVDHLNPAEMYGGEGFDHFMDEVGIFWDDYWNQLASAVVKDAFTLFEVFLEKSADGILRRRGSELLKLRTEDSWHMSDCKRFYLDYLGLTLMTQDLEDIHWIRNKLAHLRDELRTDAGKEEFATRLARLEVAGDESLDEEEEKLQLPHVKYGREASFGKALVLSPLEAWRILNIARARVDQLGIIFHTVQYRKTTEALENLRKGKPVRPGDHKFFTIPRP